MSARVLAIVVASALLVLGGAAATAAAGPSQTQPPPRSEPVDELLERFPIGEAKVTEARPTVPQRELPPPAFTPTADDSGTDLPRLTIGAAAAAVLLGIMAAGVLLVRNRRAQPTAVWETTPNLALLYETLANTDREWDKPTEHPTRRSAPVTEVSKDRNEQQPGEPEQAEDVTSEAGGSDAATSLEHAGVVEQISAILQSAEAAAAAIRAEAVAKAEQVNQAAVEEGRTHVAKAKEEASRIRADAEEAAREAQSAADSYGAKQRRETEQRVEQMLAQAEVQARATRQAAEEMARQIEEAAREREEKLKAQMRPLETSLRRALDGFRGITTQLEELLDGDAPREDKTLVEALSGPVGRSGEWEETQQQERTNG